MIFFSWFIWKCQNNAIFFVKYLKVHDLTVRGIIEKRAKVFEDRSISRLHLKWRTGDEATFFAGQTGAHFHWSKAKRNVTNQQMIQASNVYIYFGIYIDHEFIMNLCSVFFFFVCYKFVTLNVCFATLSSLYTHPSTCNLVSFFLSN